MNRKVALHTLGCKLNYAETSTIGRQFVDRGFEIVDFTQPSDVYVLNTCSVTERAERECRQIIRRALRQSPDAFIIVVGCYAQLRAGEIAAIEGVDLVLGTKEKFNILEHAGRFEKPATPQVFVSCIDETLLFAPSFSADTGGRTRAFLKIQDGCDFHCSFCTIPLARGTSRSQPADAVIRQAQLIAKEGFKEIVLTGVNVGDYGRKEKRSLLELLKLLGSLGGVDRIRISSIEPNLVSRDLVDFILESEKFCNHFHIPLQSGSDRVLKIMRRRYLSDHYRSVVDYIKQKDSDAGIGADVIVGFPGESEQMFEETCSFLGELPVSYLHVFTFSERPGTPAANYKGSVEPRERARRSEVLRILGRRKRHDFYSRFGGRTLPVLFEGQLRAGMASGLARNYVRVGAPSSAPLTNQIRNIAIRNIDDDVCIGTEVQ
ncbi:MAG: tRNA (N(6)-L-threonylcarbamoyladenosine(37)-C(2))-methylthiotransferase MtaB [Ignavibacteria bacterium 13_1_40CM_2_61_4]|nr:MAG: tRNA (N(6)-L-threonylcarbamoyladenosine(37)-C(2))-methylthiotransferase MtaB [Ignavibacteria bacterium 13_1_40CM_2_61_4]